MLSASLYTMIKLSKTTSPQKLFPSDCFTLYFKTRCQNLGWLRLMNTYHLDLRANVEYEFEAQVFLKGDNVLFSASLEINCVWNIKLTNILSFFLIQKNWAHGDCGKGPQDTLYTNKELIIDRAKPFVNNLQYLKEPIIEKNLFLYGGGGCDAFRKYFIKIIYTIFI